MNLKELYEAKRDVKESEIPEEWKESFNKFISGQTCSGIFNEDGTLKEYLYYQEDFSRWYRINKLKIERDLKINEIIKR